MMCEQTTIQPVLETERLTLRALNKADTAKVALYTSDWRVASMTSSIPHPNPPGAVELFIERVQSNDRSETTWAMDATSSLGTDLIGVIALRRDGELGYWLAPFFWGLGFATEACRAVVAYGRDTGMQRIHAYHFADNPASGRVLEKVGMTRCGERDCSFSVARDENVKSILYELRS